MKITEPIDILNEFIRSNVDEITRRSGDETSSTIANRQVADSQSFNGDTVEDTFTLTNLPVCINSVIVDGSAQTKYLHYEINLELKTITFNAGYIPGTGTDNVVVSYDKRNNWVFPDKPRDTLSRTKYPRIGITYLTENSINQGMGETDSYDGLTFQIDVVAYKDQFCIVGSENIADADVTQYLARQIIKKIKRNRAVIENKIYNPTILQNITVPFADDKHINKRIIDVSYEANNAGE